MTSPWDQIWENRTPARNRPPCSRTLWRSTGATVASASSQRTAGWRVSARRPADSAWPPATPFYEVGCGAGAILYDLHRQGYRIGGLDRSAALIGHARQAMPGGQFTCCDAADLNATESWDAVVSFSAFEYFPSYEYARQVIEAMAPKACRAVAVAYSDDSDRSVRCFRSGWVGGRVAADAGCPGPRFSPPFGSGRSVPRAGGAGLMRPGVTRPAGSSPAFSWPGGSRPGDQRCHGQGRARVPARQPFHDPLVPGA
jgi:SAM-dependent methyltransferase